MMGAVGALVTLDLPANSPVADLPWVITIGSLGDEEDWEPIVCGPYERAHALALAEAVVADEDLMAVVEPLQPHVTAEQILGDIAALLEVVAHIEAEASRLVSQPPSRDISPRNQPTAPRSPAIAMSAGSPAAAIC